MTNNLINMAYINAAKGPQISVLYTNATQTWLWLEISFGYKYFVFE